MYDRLLNWNRGYLNRGNEKPIYDNWLDKYQDVLESSRNTPIIDLGCGGGNDSLYLFERGYKVISCDWAVEALNRLRCFIENPETRLFNMVDGLPFNDNTASIIISDLSLHYFAWNDTCKIVNEISRVLINNGHLFCRVNSVHDKNYGAGQGSPVEENYYNNNGSWKRFFDEKDIHKLFGEWEIIKINEHQMLRYEEPKILWELLIKNQKS